MAAQVVDSMFAASASIFIPAAEACLITGPSPKPLRSVLVERLQTGIMKTAPFFLISAYPRLRWRGLSFKMFTTRLRWPVKWVKRGAARCRIAAARFQDGLLKPMEKTFVEFFAGIGLIHEALAELGWSAVFANDNDPKKGRVYRDNFPGVPFSDLDIRTVPW